MGRILKLAPLLGVMAISACETMQGAGRDMQTAGQLLTEQSANAQTQINQQTGGMATTPSAPYAAAPPYSPTPVPY